MEAEKLLLTALAPPLSLRRDGNLARRLTDRLPHPACRVAAVTPIAQIGWVRLSGE